MTTAPTPPPGECRGLSFCNFHFVSAVPQHCEGSKLAKHDSLLLYCTAMVAYVYQTPTHLPHYGDNVNVKSQHICQAIPALLRGLGEAVVTNDWCIIYSLCCTSHKNLVLSHLQKYQTHMTSADYIFQPISKYIPIPSLVSVSNSTVKGLNEHYFYLMSLFSLG